MSIIKLLSNTGYITVNKYFIKVLGLHEAIILGELASEYMYWENKNELNNDWFYSTVENIEENTGINGHFQRKVFKKLKDLNLIDIKVAGQPAKRYVKIIEESVINLMNNKLFTSLTPSCSPREQLDIHLVNINNNKEIKINNNNKLLFNNNNNLDSLKEEEINNTSLEIKEKDLIEQEKRLEEKKENKFVKPTIEEIRLYCIERRNKIDAEQFYHYYESKGWLIGKNHMKNWKSAVITWEKQQKNDITSPYSPYEEKPYNAFQ